MASKENRVISVVVDPDDWKRFGLKALKAGASRSAIVRSLLRSYLRGEVAYEPDKPARGPLPGRDASSL